MKKMINKNVFSLFIVLALVGFGCKKSFKEGKFESFVETPQGIIGMKELSNIKGKGYIEIKIEDNTTIMSFVNDKGEAGSSVLYTYGNDGFISKEVSRDKWGVIQSETTYEKEGDEYSLVMMSQGKNSNLPCDCEVRKYKNNLLVESRYSKQGNPCSPQSGIAKTIYERYEDGDRYGSVKSTKYFDIEGKPFEYQRIHETRSNVDKRNNTIDISYFGVGGNPVLDESGVHKTIYVYDEEDRTKEYSYFGVDKTPISNNVGVHKVVNEFKNGKLANTRNFDENNNPVKENESGNGVHMTSYKYDNNGNTIEVAYFDTNETPLNLKNGIHKTISTYDDNDHLTSNSYFSNSQRPTTDAYGIHKYLYSKNKKDQTTSVAYFDSQGNPIKDSWNIVFMIKYKYDDLGRTTSISYWKNDTQKMSRWDGHHEERTIYDEKSGQVKEQLLLNENGDLYNSGEFSIKKFKYDDNDSLVEYSFFKGDTPVEIKKWSVLGYHKIVYKYNNEDYNLIEISYFDSNGNPTNAIFTRIPGCRAHRVAIIYKNSQVIENHFYLSGSDSSPIKIQDCLSKMCLNSYGVAEIEYWKY